MQQVGQAHRISATGKEYDNDFPQVNQFFHFFQNWFFDKRKLFELACMVVLAEA